jgi:hypothetical protein
MEFACFIRSDDCRLTWEGVGAIGSLLAVIVALWLARRSGQEQRRAESMRRLLLCWQLGPEWNRAHIAVGNVARLTEDKATFYLSQSGLVGDPLPTIRRGVLPQTVARRDDLWLLGDTLCEKALFAMSELEHLERLLSDDPAHKGAIGCAITPRLVVESSKRIQGVLADLATSVPDVISRERRYLKWTLPVSVDPANKPLDPKPRGPAFDGDKGGADTAPPSPRDPDGN